jgi:hypothetical protein
LKSSLVRKVLVESLRRFPDARDAFDLFVLLVMGSVETFSELFRIFGPSAELLLAMSHAP